MSKHCHSAPIYNNAAQHLTHARLCEVLHYDPETGVFTWRLARSQQKAGTQAGTTDKTGYIVIGIDSRLFKAHRLAWFYCHGRMPKDQIDHLNGARADNRLANLREATRSVNGRNQAIPSRNTSGYRGVTLYRDGRWVANISVLGKRVHLGYCTTPELASALYLDARKKYFPEQPVPRELLNKETK